MFYVLNPISVGNEVNKIEEITHKNKIRLIEIKREIIKNRKCISCHAEVNVLQKYNPRRGPPLRKTTLIVIRIDTEGNLIQSKPCYHCCETIKQYGIKKIIYSDDDGYLRKEKVRNLDTRESIGHIFMDRLLITIEEKLQNL